MKTKEKKTSQTAIISTQLFGSLRELYFRELKYYIKQPSNKLSETDAFAPSALVFFPMSICVWEAILNEIFLSIRADWNFRDNPVLSIKDKMERWSVEDKTFKFPRLFFNRTFDESSMAYANFKVLLKLRNSITHFKYSAESSPDIQVKQLLNMKVISNISKSVWYMNLFSTECMRFCINTIADMATEMEACCNDGSIFNASFYPSITPNTVTDFIGNKPVYGVPFLYQD